MTVTAEFVAQSEDGTATYRITLVDPAHLEQPICEEVLVFGGEICLTETLIPVGE